jgi:hypothetical protein
MERPPWVDLIIIIMVTSDPNQFGPTSRSFAPVEDVRAYDLLCSMCTDTILENANIADIIAQNSEGIMAPGEEKKNERKNEVQLVVKQLCVAGSNENTPCYSPC